MLLASFLEPRNILFENRVLTKEQLYQILVDRLCSQYKLPICGSKLMELILQRDEEVSPAYSTGIAIPHIRMENFNDTLIAMAFLQNPLDYNGIKVSWVVLIITDKTSSKLYLNIVAALLKLSNDKEAVADLHNTGDGHSVIQYLKKKEVEVKKDVTIADIMVQKPIAVHPENTLRELINLMCMYRVAGMPVVDATGKYIGEVNILNLLKVGIPDFVMMLDDLSFLASYEPLENLLEKQDLLLVNDIMATDEKTLSPETSIIEAVFLMFTNKKRYLSVVKEGKLVGLVTAMDILTKVIAV
ncbi:MAG TPA: PTS sugar transporter subunit IIA [Candidatus Cloacimonas sp.]|mgnify:FL=1|jgi:PTS system nitrogen regulatory IIA component|nr:PTS sugar transporter subunit IIA [Candidatus Cloacimonas sp.]MDD2250347.1 PTS sugar transporter subunit IIA [Candidatus Cloacimonadota bacterium]MCK9165167.1 PTS sugar transporter subunit IIA [Candidatus Cloacimonas sp.]MDD3733856.1 PTS sugar transporter subunit IIA [Candidatus Cloacimonadota bacterium]MDD3869618.1 PTS sugar transporter subunit IIA [Candidatus Cloacimonadota bacterium]